MVSEALVLIVVLIRKQPQVNWYLNLFRYQQTIIDKSMNQLSDFKIWSFEEMYKWFK